MRIASTLHGLGWILAATALAMLLPAVFAMAADSLFFVQAFLIPIFAIGFVGGSLIIAFRGTSMVPTRRDALQLLAAIWIIVPLAGALPFYTAGQPTEFLDAYFEAVSGFTTTGATVFGDLSEVPRSILVWRAVLQWCGGLATLLAIAAVLGPLAGIDQIDRHLGLVRSSSSTGATHLMEIAGRITPLYLALTIACFIALVIAQIPKFDAFCLSLSTLSTGGFMPRSGSIAQYGSTAAEAVLAVFMLLGAVSIVWIRAILERRWGVVREVREPIWIFWLTIAFAVVLVVLAADRFSILGVTLMPQTIVSALATSASLISTTGFPVDMEIQHLLPYVALLLLCTIGGGRFSTAGGLKLYRVLAMLRQLGRELMLLLYPHGVRPARFGEEEQDIELMKLVWTSFVAFITSLAVLTLVLSATGIPFTGSLMAGVGALSNIGPIYDFVHLDQFPNAPSYSDMTTFAKLSLSAGMILGRLEIVAFLSLLSMSYWRQ